MAFVREKRTYKLIFADDSPLTGLTARCRSVNLGQLLAMQEVGADADDESAGPRAQAAAQRQLIMMFAPVLIEWDMVEEDGTPVPTGEAGLLSLEGDEFMALFTAWRNVLAAVPDPLAAGSTSGAPSAPAPPLTMEPPSSSQAS